MNTSSEKIDFLTKSQIESSFNTIEKIFKTNIFSPENSRSPFLQPSFVHILIHLRDIMYKSEKYANKRIDFTDDVAYFKSRNYEIKDVTDLIKFIRDAMCHPESYNHYFDDNIRASFNIVYGKGGLMSINGIDIKSDYNDDVCFFFGKAKIYLNRHIIRAYREAKEALEPLL